MKIHQIQVVNLEYIQEKINTPDGEVLGNEWVECKIRLAGDNIKGFLLQNFFDDAVIKLQREIK